MHRFNRIVEALVDIGRNNPRPCAIVLGLMAATGFPPLGWWPLSIAALAALIALLRAAKSNKDAAIIGYLFGWAHLSLANNWIATAFTFQAQMPEFLGWLAVPLLCLYLAIYPALAALAAHRFAHASSPLIYGAIFAGFWIITEWLRSWVFTGYPWPPMGLALLGGWETPGLARLLPWLGTYALSGLLVMIAAALLAALIGKRWIVAVLLVALTSAAMLAPGTPGPSGNAAEGRSRYTLVQPFIPQEERDAANKFEEHFGRLVEHTFDPSDPERLIFWPESAVPDYLRDGYPQRYYNQLTAAADPEFARKRIGQTIGSNGVLLFGVTDLEIGEKMGRETAVGAYNTVTTIDGEGRLGERYSKAHLVPYGEYLALRWLLEPLGARRLVSGSIDFIPGPGPQSMDLGKFGKAGIQICYEIVFSGQVVDRANRPDFIFNPSNDGWFGTWGPPQHLAQARLRAIEEGLPVIRSTTTGISAVIGADGMVRQHIPSGEDGGVSGVLPPAHPPTLFAKMGNLLPLLWAGLLLIGAIAAQRLVLNRRAV